MGNRPFSRKICNFFCKLTAFYPLRHGFAVPAPPRGRLCTMPGSLPPPLKPSPWTDSPRSRRDVASATEWGTGGCDQREQTEGVSPPRSGLALSVTFGDSSPKGRALGIAAKLSVSPEAPPFGGAGERSETERVFQPKNGPLRNAAAR